MQPWDRHSASLGLVFIMFNMSHALISRPTHNPLSFFFFSFRSRFAASARPDQTTSPRRWQRSKRRAGTGSQQRLIRAARRLVHQIFPHSHPSISSHFPPNNGEYIYIFFNLDKAETNIGSSRVLGDPVVQSRLERPQNVFIPWTHWIWEIWV